jgi:hypothetical protein
MGLERFSTADRVIGGAYLVMVAGASGVAGAEAGQVAAVAIAGATVGLPVVVAGVWSLAHWQAFNAEREGGER